VAGFARHFPPLKYPTAFVIPKGAKRNEESRLPYYKFLFATLLGLGFQGLFKLKPYNLFLNQEFNSFDQPHSPNFSNQYLNEYGNFTGFRPLILSSIREPFICGMRNASVNYDSIYEEGNGENHGSIAKYTGKPFHHS